MISTPFGMGREGAGVNDRREARQKKNGATVLTHNYIHAAA